MITSHDERDLCLRIESEFREMPGLTLTLPEAARLFSLDAPLCERVLRALVHAGHLWTDGRAFVRSGSDRRRA